MNLKQGCPFCFPDHEVYLEGDAWRLICTDEPNHYILVPKEHIRPMAPDLAKAKGIFQALYYIPWPAEIVAHLNDYHTSVEHLHVHVYRRG